MPAAYLKQFHEKYQDEDKLKAADEEEQGEEVDGPAHQAWRANTGRRIPSCRRSIPWRNTTKPPAEQFVFERNPYFHRVDENGLQLPYIDRFILNVSSSVDHPGQDRRRRERSAGDRHRLHRLHLPEGRREALPGARSALWKRTQGSRLALLPNLNYADAAWRPLLRDVRVRRALSLAINRHEINMAVFYGLGKESADTVLPESPLYQAGISRKAWIAHDPDQANALLDEIGLDQRDNDGIRLLPRRPLGADHRRNRRRKHAGDRCARTGHRPLARGRHRPVHPHLAARRVPQPGDRRRRS